MIDYKDLPVYKNKEQILDALRNNQVVIVESPTGSGKTTQIPLILHEAGYAETGIIGVTQPRRIAAMSVCEFIKNQIGDDKNLCGYTMRFYDTTDSTTRIKIMTDGILLQEVKDDPILSRYSVIMIDEAHERTLNIDFLLGLLKEISAKRSDLKIIISSATINTQSFSSFFDNAPIVSIDGNMFPVEVKYAPINDFDYINTKSPLFNDKICQLVYEAHLDPDGGDVLVFLPGEAEIKSCLEALRNNSYIHLPSYQIYPLYGRLSKEEQERVFIPTARGKTKVVVATNIAETSLTIDGIRTVIDAGTVKMNFYDQNSFTQSLVTKQISKASAEQRKGRAGRTQNGFCYRLYSEKSYESRKEFTEEQILHSDLAEVVLRMSELGIYNPETFPFITGPKEEALASAIETLKYIGAIDDTMHLTAIGEMMIKFPVVPRLSRVIVEAITKSPEVIEPVLTAVSFLSTKGPFITPENEKDLREAREAQHELVDNKNGDFVAYLSIYKKYVSTRTEEDRKDFCDLNYLDRQTMDEIVHIKEQLCELVRDMGVPVSENKGRLDIEKYLKCLASGLRQYICKKEDDSFYSYTYGYVDRSYYTSIGANSIYIHPACSWFAKKPKYILAGELMQTSKMFARTVSPLQGEWINEIDPRLLSNIERNRKIREEEEAELFRQQLELVKEAGSDKRYKNDIKSGINDDDIIPLTEIDNIKERSDTEVYLSCGGYVSVTRYPLKYIDADLSFVPKTDTPEVLDLTDSKYSFTATSSAEDVKLILSKLFRPCVVDDHLEFLTLVEDMEETDVYWLAAEASVLNAYGNAFYAIDDAAYAFKDTELYPLLSGLPDKIMETAISWQVEDYEQTASDLCFDAPRQIPKPVYYEEEQAVLNGISKKEFNGKKVYFLYDMNRSEIPKDEDVYTSFDNCISRVPVPQSLIGQEYNLIVSGCKLVPENRFKNSKSFVFKTMPYRSLVEKLENRLLKIYAPRREDGFARYFDYIYLDADDKQYWLGLTPDAKEAIYKSYEALKKLYSDVENADKNKKGYAELVKFMEKTMKRFRRYCEPVKEEETEKC